MSDFIRLRDAARLGDQEAIGRLYREFGPAFLR